MMFKRWGNKWRAFLAKVLAFLAATVGQFILKLLLLTCRVKVEGLDRYLAQASTDKTILVLWHNRLLITPLLLYRYARHFSYAGVVSKSRDGELIDRIINSYSAGKTIKVPHDSRFEALRVIINHIKTTSDIIIITPDGPRGPKYVVKPGVTLAALKTGASIVPFSWDSDRFWSLNTWDGLRIPKPFSTVRVRFGEPIKLKGKLDAAQEFLQAYVFGWSNNARTS